MNKQVEKIKNQYTTKEFTKMDQLKALDKKVKKPARIFAYVFGTIGTLVLGAGMCFAMKVIGDMMVGGIAMGLVGIAMVSANYKMYESILTSRKNKYAEQILAISDEILNA